MQENGKAIADVVGRLRLVNPKDPVKDEDGNITVFAPVADSGAAATIINPSRSELLGGMCKNCHGLFTVGIEVQMPPPHSDADPIRVCANCLVSLFNSGRVFRMDWI